MSGYHIKQRYIVPSVFNEMIPSVTAEIDRLQPDIVISMGEFGGRGLITVERLAQNYMGFLAQTAENMQ
jgi:pyrrolidone-carboxylate peptidase